MEEKLEARELSPVVRQFLAIKRELPQGAVLLFKIGVFFETFGEDAITASSICGTTLTRRNDAPATGFPCHAIDSYLAKFIRAGKTVALAEEMEDGGRTTCQGGICGVIRREVTLLVTPGTFKMEGAAE